MLTQRQATHCYDKAYNYIKNNGSKYFLSMGTLEDIYEQLDNYDVNKEDNS